MHGVLCRLKLHVQIDLVGRDIRRDAAKVGHALFIRREILEFGETDGAAVGELHDHLALRAAGRPAADDRHARLLHDAGKHFRRAGGVLVDKNDHRHIEIRAPGRIRRLLPVAVTQEEQIALRQEIIERIRHFRRFAARIVAHVDDKARCSGILQRGDRRFYAGGGAVVKVTDAEIADRGAAVRLVGVAVQNVIDDRLGIDELALHFRVRLASLCVEKVEREILLRLCLLRVVAAQQLVKLFGSVGGYVNTVHAGDHVADLHMRLIGRRAGRYGKNGQITVIFVVLRGHADADILVRQREFILLILGSRQIVACRVAQRGHHGARGGVLQRGRILRLVERCLDHADDLHIFIGGRAAVRKNQARSSGDNDAYHTRKQ